ncbi:hypothetical protein [Mycolicibacterium sp. F2034L]|uniref:hypothetical protein n=1 Tax=Mycolicibacterium sp. F2034L TaxID=2926422 RepID=UPI001FF15B35|nr:hypothetical protein [Mycolicibacterium sp. F2034L]MCK0174777.1 hypothetical protein [Mycolicibacterium sp. F2034L]
MSAQDIPPVVKVTGPLVMGFVAQCSICPQKAVLTEQAVDWVCPRCADAFGHGVDCGLGQPAPGFGDITIDRAEPIATVTMRPDDPLVAAIVNAPDWAPGHAIVCTVEGQQFRLVAWERHDAECTHDRAVFTTRWEPVELPEGPPYVVGRDFVLGDRVPVDPNGPYAFGVTPELADIIADRDTPAAALPAEFTIPVRHVQGCICPPGAVHAWCALHGQPDDEYPIGKVQG